VEVRPDKSDQTQPGQEVKAVRRDDAQTLPCKVVKQSELMTKGVYKAEVKLDSVMRRLRKYRKTWGEDKEEKESLEKRIRKLRGRIKDQDGELGKEAYNRSKAEKDVLVQVREISALEKKLEDA
jgi:septal ring factor EnvC (AmiA/AmiB activator)